MKIRVIVNPRAGAGAAGRKVPRVVAALRAARVDHELCLTQGPGDATALALQAIADAVDVVAIVGGDGTLNEVCQAYVGPDGEPRKGPALALVPAGTGGDFRRIYGLGRQPEPAIERLLAQAPRPLDLGVVELTSDRGELVRRAFVNIASFGVSGRIDRLVNEGPKWLGGRLAFALGTVRAMSTYRNARVKITVDDAPFYQGPVVVGAIANGRFFGGGMQVAPNADPADGLFDVVVLGDLGFGDSLALSPRFYKGKHVSHPLVHSTRGRVVEATPMDDRPVFVDTDGETPGRLPLRARIYPGALSIRA